MADAWINYKYFFILFTFCIGPGDGRWRRKDRATLYRDIEVFKKMAEKIEHEIETFYEDYPNGQIKRDDIDTVQKEYVKNTFHRKPGTQNLPHRKDTRPFAFTSNTTNEILRTSASDNTTQSALNPVSFVDSHLPVPQPNWPKFEELLLNMGKRYDWSHDRWIKVKKKLVNQNGFPKKVSQENSVSLHEKHKFSYRTVKLNKKSRRNVVIAVTAVR